MVMRIDRLQVELLGAAQGKLEVVHGAPDGARIDELQGATSDYDPAEIFEMAAKLQKKM